MKYLLAASAAILFCLAMAAPSDAQKKDKDKAADNLPPRADEVPKYMKMLTGSSAKDRALAAKKIGLRGVVNFDDVKDAISPLMKALEKDGDADVRKESARALGNIKPDAKDTVPLLTKTVETDKVMDVKLAATVALGQYAEEAKEALPTLRKFAGEFTDKKSPQLQTVQQSIKLISGAKGKK
jgi:HEAT repeat protein